MGPLAEFDFRSSHITANNIDYSPYLVICTPTVTEIEAFIIYATIFDGIKDGILMVLLTEDKKMTKIQSKKT